MLQEKKRLTSCRGCGKKRELSLSGRARSLVGVSGALVLLCVSLTGCQLINRGNPKPISPDYTPSDTESAQAPIENDKIDAISDLGGGAIRISFQTEANVSLSEKKVTLYYANHIASDQDVSLLLTVGNTVVAKSELITPGHEIRELALDEYAARLLQVGGYDAKLVIRSYDRKSGEKAMVETDGHLLMWVTE